MKSVRRHELQTNELADWLGEHLKAIKPYATQISVGVVAIAAAVLLGTWWFGSSERVTALGWSDYFGALNGREPEKALEAVVAGKTGSAAALWAKQAVGDMNLELGSLRLFSDRAEARKLLDKAKAAYEQVEAAASGQPDLLARAQLGLGKVHESLCQPDEAHKYYQRAAASSRDSAIRKLSEASAARMKREREVALLAWFDQQTPKKPPPLPGFGGETPGLPSDLPERPDISFPGSTSLGEIGGGLPAEPPPALPLPASAATPEPNAAPAATTPDEPKAVPPSARDQKPAEAKVDAAKSGNP